MSISMRSIPRLLLSRPSVSASGHSQATSNLVLAPLRYLQSVRVGVAAKLDDISEQNSSLAGSRSQHTSTSAAREVPWNSPAQLSRECSAGACKEGNRKHSRQLTNLVQWRGRGLAQPSAPQRSGKLSWRSVLQTQVSTGSSMPSAIYSTAAAESSEMPASAAILSNATADVTEQEGSAEALSAQGSAVSPGRLQNTPPPPWTPTRELKKRNFLPRRMGHLMQVLEREAAERAAAAKQYPEFKPGDILELKLAVPENKGRPATIKGLCISRRNRGWRTSFTLLNYIPGGGPVERAFPLYSPTIQSLSVIGNRRMRRAKLYYLRKRKPSEYRA